MSRKSHSHDEARAPEAAAATRGKAARGWAGHFGHADSEFGWEMERIAVDGAGGDLLRPFNCRNHFDIANGKPYCGTTADRSTVPAGQQARPPRNKRP